MTVSRTVSVGSSSESWSTSPIRSRHSRVGLPGSTPSTHASPALRAVALEDLDRRRLAGAVRAEEPEDLAGRDLEVDAAHGLVVPVGLVQVADADDWLFAAVPCTRSHPMLAAARNLRIGADGPIADPTRSRPSRLWHTFEVLLPCSGHLEQQPF